MVRRMKGREFQSLGATAENARSPYVFRRACAWNTETQSRCAQASTEFAFFNEG